MKQYFMPSEKRKIGDIGEEIAVIYLKRTGHTIMHRNYARKWGEIDIVTQKSGVLHFIEVKSVSSETFKNPIKTASFFPEEHVNYAKRQHLRRIITSFLLEQHVSDETLYQVDVAVVQINAQEKIGKVQMFEHIEIE